MSRFCSAMVLCEQTSDSLTYLKAVNPADFDFENDLDIIINNAFYSIERMPDLIYSFVAREYFCYNWVLEGGDSLHSIIILSRLNIPSLYFTFFNTLREELPKNKNEVDPLVIFDYAYSLITSWKWVARYKVLVHYPKNTCYLELNKNTIFFPEFNPYKYFQFKEVDEMWKALLTGSGLHIVAENPEILSAATYAACSLLDPIQFLEKVLITMNPDDERLQHTNDYGIISTTPNVEIDSLRNIGLAVEAKLLNPGFDIEAARNDLQSKTCSIIDVLVSLMDRVLRTNPYNDILEAPYITDDLENLFDMSKENSKFRILPPIAFRKMEYTKSIASYRRGILFRSSFRHNFLSMKPEEALRGMSKQHLMVISNQLDKLAKKFETDKHFVSVINVHKKIIKKSL
ncbi:hypothetical protein TRFO_16625 [Tritrichomonas foetus]|uniref:Uncharacterized protein n=1 Tax=Tritrichomonas foetus TaxID=1144522 RepID=A0A1J4KPS6_9EUKA|nr:hypothetical protein TRFO_16625 [Tritrichomonas foetus]|eukprot:OHT13295.1 hypothetical protein TRFO_16625 [Tritrichomonas foetus]